MYIYIPLILAKIDYSTYCFIYIYRKYCGMFVITNVAWNLSLKEHQSIFSGFKKALIFRGMLVWHAPFLFFDHLNHMPQDELSYVFLPLLIVRLKAQLFNLPNLVFSISNYLIFNKENLSFLACARPARKINN